MGSRKMKPWNGIKVNENLEWDLENETLEKNPGKWNPGMESRNVAKQWDLGNYKPGMESRKMKTWNKISKN